MADGFFDWLGETASGIGSGLGEIASDVAGAWPGVAKTLGTLGQLGSAGLNIYSGIQAMEQGGQQQKQQEQQQERFEHSQEAAQAEREQQWARNDEIWNAGAGVRAAGSELTEAGKQALLSGQLPPLLEARVTEWLDKQRTQLHDYFARAGIGDSSMMAQWEAYLNQQAQAMRGQLAQQLLQGGGSTFTAGMSGAGQIGPMPESIVQPPQASAQGTGSLIQAAQQALGLLTGADSGDEQEEEEPRQQAGTPGGERNGLSDILRPENTEEYSYGYM